MGVDIHMYVVKDKKVVADIATDIFDNFRNYEWFDNISRNEEPGAYEYFTSEYGISKQAPDEIVKESTDFGCYDRFSITVKDFINWFRRYRPDKDAGWVTTYEKWQYENYSKIPYEICHYLPENANINDMHFIEMVNVHEPARELYEYLMKDSIPMDADIVYWFDH